MVPQARQRRAARLDRHGKGAESTDRRPDCLDMQAIGGSCDRVPRHPPAETAGSGGGALRRRQQRGLRRMWQRGLEPVLSAPEERRSAGAILDLFLFIFLYIWFIFTITEVTNVTSWYYSSYQQKPKQNIHLYIITR